MANQNRRRRAAAVVLWGATLAWYGVCLFLSWQPGEETAETSWGIAGAALALLNRVGIQPDPDQFHSGLRLSAHFGIFFVGGFFQALTLSVPSPSAAANASWRLKPKGAGIAAAISALFSVATEVGKVNIPGRHLELHETVLNAFGAVCGALTAWGCNALVCKLRAPKQAPKQ